MAGTGRKTFAFAQPTSLWTSESGLGTQREDQAPHVSAKIHRAHKIEVEELGWKYMNEHEWTASPNIQDQPLSIVDECRM